MILHRDRDRYSMLYLLPSTDASKNIKTVTLRDCLTLNEHYFSKTLYCNDHFPHDVIDKELNYDPIFDCVCSDNLWLYQLLMHSRDGDVNRSMIVPSRWVSNSEPKKQPIIYHICLNNSIKIAQNCNLNLDIVYDNNTVLIHSVKYNFNQMCQLLLNHSNMTQKCINFKNDKRQSALHWACSRNNKYIVKLLVDDKRTNVNDIAGCPYDEYQNVTQLMAAILREEFEIAKILVDSKRMNLNIQSLINSQTLTPLEMAKEKIKLFMRESKRVVLMQLIAEMQQQLGINN